MVKMDIGNAFRHLLDGKEVRRLDWEDEKVRLKIINEKLMIFDLEDELWHPLIVSSGDIAGTDWVIVKEGTQLEVI